MQGANVCLGAPQTLIYLQVAIITFLPVSIFVFPPNTYILTWKHVRVCLQGNTYSHGSIYIFLSNTHLLTWKYIFVSVQTFIYLYGSICVFPSKYIIVWKLKQYSIYIFDYKIIFILFLFVCEIDSLRWMVGNIFMQLHISMHTNAYHQLPYPQVFGYTITHYMSKPK